MSDRELLRRISVNPKIMTGKPVISGTRVTVETVLNQLAHGATEEEILADYPKLTEADIRACLLFALRNITKFSSIPVAMESA